MTRKSSVSNRASTLALAIALVVGPTPAVAQSFQGSGNFTTNGGGAADISPGTQSTTITLNPGQTVIDWTPTDDAIAPGVAIAFQPADTTATFISTDDFAVLNRINVTDTSRMISLNGTINSIVGEITGGSVFFYSPAGFVIGSSAVIDVGSLVLTSSPITVDGNGNFINGGTVEFGQSLAGGQVVTNAGSSIKALNESSYVAMVAPRVSHGGTIEVNGGAALVGAEAATITFRPSGLFDIEVDVGTTDSNGVGIDGTITGPQSGGPGDYHRIYAVAVPKNTALTLAIGGGASLGFDVAGAAEVIGNAVVLSAGHDVTFGDTDIPPSGASGADADISIAETSFTSALDAAANGDLFASAVDFTIDFASDASFRARDLARLEANGTGIVDVAGNLSMSADRTGTVEGQSVTAGNVTLQAFAGGTINVDGTTDLSARGTGGSSDTPGVASGNGTGGTILVQATTGGDITLGDTADEDALYANVTGRGGNNNPLGADAGSGFGGTVNVFASGGGTLHVTGAAYLTADGEGGFPVECLVCGGVGGVGDAGAVNVQAHSGPGSSITIDDVLYVWAVGVGSYGQTGDGGAGLGGNIVLSAQVGSAVSVGGDIALDASGEGGLANAVGNGGLGRGGSIFAFTGGGGTLTPGGNITLTADGTGGDTGEGNSGIGGDGLGGQAEIIISGSTMNVTGFVEVTAEGIGGTSLEGTGGDGTGNIARINATGGDINITGSATVSASGYGGFGTTGGDGIGGGDYFADTGGAHIYARNGDIVITGSATAISNGFGGHGSNGGDGGDGSGGWASIHAANGDGGPSMVTVAGMIEDSAIVSASGFGGDGGDGLAGTDGTTGATGTDGTAGGTGGDGGTGTGGVAAITASAGNGTMNVPVGFIVATGTGGFGGAGGDGGAGGNGLSGAGGDGGNGGTGGVGGMGIGGLAAFGVEPGTAAAAGQGNGVGNFSLVELDGSSLGGNGGDGGFGGAAGTGTPAGTAGANGNGGNGGDAGAGTAYLEARGGTTNVDFALLTANSTGGDGGFGAVDGVGGDAESDEVAVLVLNRPGDTAIRGELNAGTIIGEVISTGGVGSTNGVGSMEGGSGFLVVNGDATIGSLDLNIVADEQIADLATDPIVLINGDVQIATSFTFNTSGVTSIYAENGTLDAGTFNVSASNFVHDTEQLEAPNPIGTISAGTFDLTTGQDLIIDAHLVSVGSLDLLAPGLIDIEDLTSSDGDLSLNAGESITAGSLEAAGFIDILAFGTISVADLTGSLIDLESEDGDILFGEVDANELDFDAAGAVTGGNIVATTLVGGEAGGAVDLGNITVGPALPIGEDFSVGIASATSIEVDDVSAVGNIGFASIGNLTTGDLSGGNLVMTLVGGDIETGSIVTAEGGQVYMGNVSMFLDNGGPDDFNPAAVLAVDPLMTGGSIEIGGPVSTGLFRAAAGTSFIAGDITALGFEDELIFEEGVNVRAGGTATVDGDWTGEEVTIVSNDIDITGNGEINGEGATLYSTNPIQTVVGNGVSGGGYQLSDAEFDKIHFIDELEMGAWVGGGADDRLLFGALTANVASPGTEYEFSVFQDDSEDGIGSMRVVGNMVFTGQADYSVDFATLLFELDAATGSISLFSSGTTLAGELWFDARDIHVAEGDILDRLADEPQYEGYRDDLNTPTEVERPEGVIKAASINFDLEGNETATIYVQNTGTADLPAGFLVTDQIFIGEDGELTMPPGSVDVVINGQIITPDGTLTGVDVRDVLVEDQGDLTPFTENSMINGCLLTGPCVVEPPEPPFPPDFQPSPGIQQEIVLAKDNLLPPPEFGNEDFIDDNDEETDEGSRSPIEPPDPLFDTSELGEEAEAGGPVVGTSMRSHPGLTEPGDVDDPVSGSGNPALMETPPKPPVKEEKQQ